MSESRTSSLAHLLDWHVLDDAVWSEAIQRAVYHHEHAGRWTDAGRGRSIALMFFNPSLRTRTSMELAAAQLGAYSTPLTPGQGTWKFAFGKGQVMDGDEAEHIKEAIGVLSRYYDAIGVRVFASQTDYEQDRSDRLIHTIAESATVPIINLESAFFHPCQALADAATIHRRLEQPAGRKFVLTWAYHPKALPMAVPNSALLMAARLGMDVTVAHPRGFELDDGVLNLARSYTDNVRIVNDPDEAFEDADVIYAKAWAGSLVYSDPEREQALRSRHREWRVTAERMARTNDGVFMHCLPVRRNVVVDDSVIDSDRSIHLLQAEFRLHAQKAILEYVWNLR